MGHPGEHHWIPQEISQLVEMVEADGLDWVEIADRLGIPLRKCKSKYQYIMAQRREQSGEKVAGFSDRRLTAFADRDVRAAAKLQRDQEAELRGDFSHLIGDMPPPGYSALDKRRARA